MLDRFHRFLLTLIGLIVLFHSVSLYAVSPSGAEELVSLEMTEDSENEEIQLQAYDALIPTAQGMAPLVLYFLSEVVLLSEAEYLEIPFRISYENKYLEILFPLIISPNAP